MPDPVTPAFTTTLDTLITNVTSVGEFFVQMFVSIADMLFSSPFVLFIGLAVVIGILGVAASYLRIRKGGRRRR